MEFHFDASDFDVFGSQMSAAATALPREMQGSMEGAVVAGIDLAHDFAPVETGDLRSSIGPLGVPSARRGAYGPSAIHAWMREKGGTIVGNPWLVFQVGGRWVKVRQVTQSGTHYMQRSAVALRPKLHDLFAGAVRRALSSLGGR
jgi:hypothetical protein